MKMCKAAFHGLLLVSITVAGMNKAFAVELESLNVPIDSIDPAAVVEEIIERDLIQDMNHLSVADDWYIIKRLDRNTFTNRTYILTAAKVDSDIYTLAQQCGSGHWVMSVHGRRARFAVDDKVDVAIKGGTTSLYKSRIDGERCEDENHSQRNDRCYRAVTEEKPCWAVLENDVNIIGGNRCNMEEPSEVQEYIAQHGRKKTQSLFNRKVKAYRIPAQTVRSVWKLRDGKAISDYGYARYMLSADKTTMMFLRPTTDQLNHAETSNFMPPADAVSHERLALHRKGYVNVPFSFDGYARALNECLLMGEQQPGQRRQLIMQKAWLLANQGVVTESLTLVDGLLNQKPDDIELLGLRAQIAGKFNKLDIMEADLRRIIDLDPDNAMAMNSLGYALTNRTDRYKEALLLIEKALTIKPNQAEYIDSFGWVHYKLNNYDKSITHLRRALKMSQNDEIAAHLGEVLWVTGQRAEAIKVWDKALELAPESEILLETVKRLRGQ